MSESIYQQGFFAAIRGEKLFDAFNETECYRSCRRYADEFQEFARGFAGGLESQNNFDQPRDSD
jgi:hypothetical protein